MPSKNNEVFEILSNVKYPIFAAYDIDGGYPSKTIIGYHKCEDCSADVIINCSEAPSCPCCAGSLNIISEDTEISFNKNDYNNLAPLCACENCGTGWKSKFETVSELLGTSIYCLFCASPTVVNAADSMDDTDYSTDNTKPMNTDDMSKDITNTDNSDTPSDDTTEADKELDEALKKLNLKDKSDTKSDPTSAPATDDSKSTTDDSSTVTSDDDEDNSDDDDSSDDEDEETDASELVYSLALKEAKNISVIASKDYQHWYMFSDNSPLAIASFDKADSSVQRIFHSDEFITALESAIKSEGNVHQSLMKDFGFEPVKVNLKIDDLTKRMVEEEVAEKTKAVNEKLGSISEYWDQSIGVASVGIVKGFYNEANDFRESLIATLTSNNVRDPELLVESFLAKNLPNLMKSVVVIAKDLMSKSPEALQEVASMIKEASPRAYAKPNRTPAPVIAITSSFVDKSSNKDNLPNKNSSSNVVDKIFSKISRAN